MIKMWVHPRVPFYGLNKSLFTIVNIIDGSVDLLNARWFGGVYLASYVKIGMDFLNKGFKI